MKEFSVKIPIERLKKVAMCSNYPVSDNRNAYKQTLEDIERFIKTLPSSNIFKGTYTRRNKLDYGRLVCDKGIQYWQKDVKCFVFGKSLIDIDQKNSHLVIIKWLLKKYMGVEDKFLDDYIENRDKALVKYNLGSKDTMLSVINKSTIFSKHHEKVREFHKKIYGPQGLLIRMFEDYAKNKDKLLVRIRNHVTEKNAGHPNIHGKMFSLILQGYEDLTLNYMTEFIEKDPELQVSILMFDGMLCKKNPKFTEELLRNMEEYVLEHTTIPVKLAYKSMDTEWRPIVKEEEEEEEEETFVDSKETFENFSVHKAREICQRYWKYDDEGRHVGIDWNCEDLVEYLNIYFCHFQEPSCTYGFRNNPRDRYRYIKHQDLEHITLSTSPSSKDYPISHMYRKHINILMYDKVDFLVDYKNDDVINEVWPDTNESKNLKIFNIFNRPYSIHSDTIEEDAEEIFTYIREIIANNDSKAYKLILDWISYIKQYGKTGIALVLMGKKGTGKGVFMSILYQIFGDDYCYTDQCGARLGSRFNSYEEGKLLGVFEEVLNNNGDMHSRNELMKSKITDKQTMVEAKGVDIKMMTNNCNYVFVTNGQNPVKIEKDERRYVALNVSDKMMQNKKYFERIVAIATKYKCALRAFFERRLVTKYDMVVIETEGNKNLMYLNASNLQDWIEFELDEYMSECDKVPTKELHNVFKNYCIENDDYRKVPNVKYFSDYLNTHSKYYKMIDRKGMSFITRKK